MSTPERPDASQRLDRQAEATHRQRLAQMLEQLPHHETVESRALRAMLRRVVGQGTQPTDSAQAWRGGTY
jgi:hypothetical protein